jgi:outer membrane protein OmpA-like peptidoglycan-associated protein
MLKRSLIVLIILLMSMQVAWASGTTRTVEGVSLPETLVVDGKTVALNGAGVRKVMFMQPYVGGLYLRGAETDASTIMMADELMVIKLALTRSTGRRMMLRALRNGMRSAVGTLPNTAWEDVEGRYDSFTESLSGDFEDGSIVEFIYVPGEGLRVIRDGSLVTTVEGLDFKQAFFGIWLNSDSPADEDLKKALIAGDMRVSMAEIKKQEEQLVAQADAAAAEKEAAAAREKAEAEAEAAAAAAAAVAAAEADAEAEAKAEADAKAKAEAEAVRMAEKKAAEEAARKAEAEKTVEVAVVTPPETKPAVATITQDQFVGKVVYFGFDDASLSAESKKILDEKVQWLKANPNAAITLEASTDEQGAAVYNQMLAGKRGESVKKYFEQAGIASNRISLKVVGAVPGDNYAENRRVQFRLK